ncbi:hypothetical protein HNY73_011564, partial [Argiope bruennichi]
LKYYEWDIVEVQRKS